MTTITVLAGERSVGGTQIVIEDGGARLLFDCGILHDPVGDPFAHVAPRPWRTLADLLVLGRAPLVPDLYAPAAMAEVPDTVAPAVVPMSGPLGVALSHAHLDNSYLAPYVDPTVPILASEATARLLPVLGESGALAAPLRREITGLPAGEAFELGPMRVRFVPVDHDVGGAGGLLIETIDGIIAYSGDLRLHGTYPMRTLAFAQTAREAGAKLLILEGTRLYPPEDGAKSGVYDRVEAEVVPEMIRALARARGKLGVTLVAAENGERIEALARAAHDSGRLLTLDLSALALTTAALGRPPAAPHAVYLPSALALRMEDGIELPPRLSATLRAAPTIVTAGAIASDPGSYLLRLPFQAFADLLEIVGPGGGGTILRANSAPPGRFDPACTHLEWWASFLGMTIVECGSSGHAAPRDLALIAAHSGAPMVMPVHSFHRELMPVPSERLLVPERGRRYELCSLVPGA